MPKEITSKEYWDTYWGEGKPRYPNYNRTQGLWYSIDLLLSETIAKTRQRLGKQRLKILDCGCGEGLFLKFLHEGFDDIELYGVDYSDAIEKAEMMADEMGYQFNLKKCDLLEGWDQDYIEGFDIVVSLGLVEHFEDPQEILSQLTIPLVSGGSLVTLIPSFEGAWNFLWKLYDKENYAYHIPIRTVRLQEIHRNIGLTDVETYSLGIPGMPGPHNPNTFILRTIKLLTMQINRRILKKLYPRQESLSKSYPMASTVACVGRK